MKVIGLLFTFFLNVVNCKKGDSFVCSPDEPHAYIQGELMESMVNSDNVVRGGLTPKYKDTKTLVEMLKYEFTECRPTRGEKQNQQNDPVQCTRYPTGYQDFMVVHLEIKQAAPATFSHSFNSLTIAFVLSGSCVVEMQGLEPFQMGEKRAYMILPEMGFKLQNTSANLEIYFSCCDI